MSKFFSASAARMVAEVMAKQAKPKKADLVAKLEAATNQLREMGVKTFPYVTENLSAKTPSSLASCIEWATETIDNIKAMAK